MRKFCADTADNLSDFSYNLILWGSVFCFLLSCLGVYFCIQAKTSGFYPCGLLSQQVAETASLLLFQIFLYATFTQALIGRYIQKK